MVDYANKLTLVQALKQQDLRTIHKCISAGQDLNQIDLFGDTLLMASIWDNDERSFLSLMAFRKHLDLDIVSDNFNAISYTRWRNPFPYLNILLQKGAAPFDPQFSGFSQIQSHRRSDFEHICMLLSAGLDPEGKMHSMEIKAEVRRWLQALDCIKILVQKIFDNPVLESEICSFVYNEVNLRKIL